MTARTHLRLALLGCAIATLGCGPLVDVDGDASAGTDHAPAGTSSGPAPSSVECEPAVEQACSCPGAYSGTRYCQGDGVFGPCVCDTPYPSTGPVVESTGAWEGSSGGTSGASSTGADEPIDPGACLPLDQPCGGNVWLETDADVLAVATCSRIEGSLMVGGGVTDLSPMSCLRELGNQLYVEAVTMPSLADLSHLERIEGELEIGWTGLTTLNLDALVSVGYFSLYQNDSMVTLGVPNLALIESGIDVTDNPMLPTCELQTLAEGALSPMGSAYYVGNADDGCPSTD